MADEKRLIDANAVEAKIEKSFRRLIANQNKPDLAAALSYVGDLIIEAPTVDAVEVCRCKDCKHCKKYRNRLDPMLNHQLCVRMDNYAFGVDEDDFCSYGERRNNETEEPV